MGMSGKEKARQHRKRHRQERETARKPVDYNAHRVIELFDGQDVAWVEAVPVAQEAYWRKAWPYRDILDTPLARWLKTQAGEPTEHTLFDRLDGPTARKLAAFLMRGASLREPLGRRYGRRTAIVKSNGEITAFASIADAARSVGLWPFDGRRLVGRQLPDGSRLL